MRWNEGYIAVDWGTTNRRAYRIGADGACAAEMEDGCGISSLAPGAFAAAAAAIRADLGDLPMLLAGMVGSNRGWVEAPYADCPAGLGDLAAAIVPVEGEEAVIVPGVSLLSGMRADVMRGEEVQIVGAVAACLIPADCFVCHPGTHNKWIAVEGGRIVDFRSAMTGEMFSLLKAHSILADLLAADAAPDEAFRAGAARGLADAGLAAALFGVRAAALLGRASPGEAASFVSGLLIGDDVRIGLRDAPQGKVVVMGRPELTALYAAALAVAGRDTIVVDGEEAFLAGAAALAEKIA